MKGYLSAIFAGSVFVSGAMAHAESGDGAASTDAMGELEYATPLTTGPRSITSMGCHYGGVYNSSIATTCYVTISGAAVGPGGCVSNSLRWDVSTVSGKEIFGLLKDALMNGKTANFEVNGSCYENQASYPTFRWFYVYP